MTKPIVYVKSLAPQIKYLRHFYVYAFFNIQESRNPTPQSGNEMCGKYEKIEINRKKRR